MSFSNSAISARMPITSLPVREVVSMLVVDHLELDALGLKLSDDVVEIHRRPRQAVELAHQQRVALADVSEAALQLRASAISAAALLLENVLGLAASA